MPIFFATLHFPPGFFTLDFLPPGAKGGSSLLLGMEGRGGFIGDRGHGENTRVFDGAEADDRRIPGKPPTESPKVSGYPGNEHP